MPQVVQEIQDEVDAQSGLIVDTWWDERRLDRLLAETRHYQYPSLAAMLQSGLPRQGTPQPEAVDLREAGNVLDELSMILNRWALYQDFVQQRWEGTSRAVTESALSRKVTELLAPAFGTLAAFVFRKSVEIALEIDEPPAPGGEYTVDAPLVSSVVDDTLLVLNTLTDQTVMASCEAVQSAVFPGFGEVLQRDVVGVIQRRLRDNAPSAALLNAAVEHRTEVFLVDLNNLTSLDDYLGKILERLRDRHPADVVDAFAGVASAYKRRADEVVSDNVKTLFSSHIGPQVRMICNQAFSGNYLMTATAPESTKATAFELQYRKAVAAVRRALHPAVYNRLMSYVASLVAKFLEKWIFSLEGNVNELGAIALDRDVSRVVSIVAESDYALRKRFVRVAQLVTLIGEDEEELETELTEAEMERARRIKR